MAASRPKATGAAEPPGLMLAVRRLLRCVMPPEELVM
jgi:hypothetical protein